MKRGAPVFCFAVPSYERDALARRVETLCSRCEAAQALSARSRVLVKPNLLAKHAPEKAVTTHPAVLAAVLEALQKRGVTDITVADSPGGLYNAAAMKSIYAASGLAEVCARYGAKAYTACEWAPRKTNGALVREFSLIRPALEADFIVNVPKLKTHVMTGLSCAVKNLFGTVPGLQKAEFHMRFPEKERFGDMLTDLCETVRPQLTVVDGVQAMEGDGPAGGAPCFVGLVAGGEDPYAIDLVMCRLIGLSAGQVPYLAAAQKRGLCAKAPDDALLLDPDGAAAPIGGYKLPESYANIDFATHAPRALRWAVPGMERWIAPRPKINRKKCIGCGKCAQICPGHTIKVENQKAKILQKDCIRCFCCHEMCPVKAIDVKRFGAFKL